MTLRRAVLPIALIACAACSAWAGTPASFRGRVVESATPNPDMIYVLGANGSLRKVRIAGAQVVYSQQVPRRQREQQPAARALRHGAEVRVLAEENGAGVWHARSIEILRLAGARSPRDATPPPAPSQNLPVLSRRSSL